MTRQCVYGAVWIILLGFSVALFGQGGATLTGVVTDPGGLAVVGAKIEATNHDTAIVYFATTNEAGRYTIANLPPGQYELAASRQGFARLVRESFAIHVAETLAIDLPLQVGSVEQTMNVSGGAPVVDTTTSSLSGLVEQQQLSELPLNGRNYIGLTLMQPGIVNIPNMVRTSGATSGTWFSANGATQRSNNFLLDGAILQTFNGGSTASLSGTTLGLDGISEYRVITNSFAAEYGITSGSQTVMVSKSGTNNYHGSVFEYLRNDVLDAANYFDTPAANSGRRLPPFRRNNFGGSFGGPIIKDKTFFFATFESLHERKGLSIVTNTLGAGCKGAAGATITSTACPQLPAGTSVTIAPIIAPIVNLYPDPNLAGNKLSFPFSQPTTVNYGLARVDHNFSSNDRFFGRYNIDDANTIGSLPYPQFVGPLVSRNQYLTVGEDHVFSAQALNNIRLSASRTAAARGNPTNLIGSDYSFEPGQVIPQIMVSGLTTFGPVKGATKVNQTILTLADDVSYTPGRHAFKFGALINRFRWDMQTLSNVSGGITFNSVANFLQGRPNNYTAVTSTNVTLWRTYNFYTLGFYAQDSWKARQNLTLNLGLRYEPRTDVLEANGIMSYLANPATDASYIVGSLFRNPTWKNFSPRVGFAWDVWGDGKTAVRGGGALMYDIANIGTALITQVLERPPFSNTSSLNAPSGGFLTLTKPLSFPASALGKSGNGTWEYNLRQPKLYTWNLAFEQQLPASTSLTLAYAGSRGTQLYQTSEGNPAVPSSFDANGLPVWVSAADPTGKNNVLTNPNWGFIPVIGSHGDSYYHSLQTSIRKQMTHGLLFQSSFTWSRNIDNTQSQATGDATNSPSYRADPFSSRYDRGLSALNVSKIFVFNAVYNLPSPKFENRFASGLIGGWSVSGILTLQDGIPFTPNIATNQSLSQVNGGAAGNSGGIDRPNVNPAFTGPVILGRPDKYFDPTAFVLQPLGHLGNSGRNSLIGPGLQTLDFSLRKEAKLGFISERSNLEFRAEAFNLLNHPNFALPNNVIFSGTTGIPLATAGQILKTATDARQVQVSLRFAF